jgi:hypothetical protein
VAGFFRLDEIAELANAGTLIAFIAVGVCLMVLRKPCAGNASRVSLPRALSGRHARDPWLPLSAVQPAEFHAEILRLLEPDRAGRLFRLWLAAQRSEAAGSARLT